MTPFQATCSRQFFPAFHNSGTRKLKDIWWVVLHDEEAPSAKGAAQYFQSPNAGGSADLCVDDQDCYRCLANNVVPWGASSSFGANTHGFHIEQAGYAKWSLVIWERHRRTLDRAAYKTAFHLKKFGLPVQFVGAHDLLEGVKGVTTHAEISKASRKQDPGNKSRYTHSDPGLFWPKNRFMRRVADFYAEL